MYSYYFLTSFKPELKYSIWWKKHITQIQLVREKKMYYLKLTVIILLQIQFAILVIHFLNPILFFECDYPKGLAFIGLTQNLFMFILFSDFYYKAYVKRKIKC